MDDWRWTLSVIDLKATNADKSIFNMMNNVYNSAIELILEALRYCSDNGYYTKQNDDDVLSTEVMRSRLTIEKIEQITITIGMTLLTSAKDAESVSRISAVVINKCRHSNCTRNNTNRRANRKQNAIGN